MICCRDSPASRPCWAPLHLREKGGHSSSKCEGYCNTSFISTLQSRDVKVSRQPPHTPATPLPPRLGSHSFSLSKHFASRCHNREFHPPSPGWGGGGRGVERVGRRPRLSRVVLSRRKAEKKLFHLKEAGRRTLKYLNSKILPSGSHKYNYELYLSTIIYLSIYLWAVMIPRVVQVTRLQRRKKNFIFALRRRLNFKFKI